MISQWITHRDPALWDQPEVFRPERWANKSNIVPWSYFPFGGGSRICIGMPFAQQEGRLLLATILQSYVPELLPSTKVTLYTGITLRPRHGLVMQVQPISKIA